MKIDGKCYCGSIAYEAEVDPEKVYICHCNDCQSMSGSAFRWAVPVAEENFTLLSGQPKIFTKISDSGAKSHQLFCSECSAPIYSISERDGPKFYNLRLGSANQRRDLIPKKEIWHGSTQTWVDIPSLTIQLDKQ